MGASVEQSAATQTARMGATPSPPGVQIYEMYIGTVVTQMLEVVAEHQIAQRLADGPRTAAELAAMAGVHEPSLYRVMRTLTGFGLFSEVSEGRFALGPLGQAAADYFGGGAYPWFVEVMNRLPQAVKTGEVAFELAHGVSLFEFLGQRPEAGAAFDAVMTAVHGGEKEALAEAYDLSDVRTLVDIGGGNGTLLTIMLERYPDMRGVLFDVPPVIERAAPLMDKLADRCQLIAGDFFEGVPSGGDVYVLSHVIHDWDQEPAVAILRNCRDAMRSNSKLLLVEMVMPSGDAPHPARMLDMMMLLLTDGGMERSERQYGELLDQAGFRLRRLVRTQSPASVIEAVPV